VLAARGDRARAQSVLAEAAEIAAQLGAEPLGQEVELLARRARLTPRNVESELGLTPREEEVLAHVAAGRTNRQIAEALYISDRTAAVHVSHILTKLGATSRGEAAALAHEAGLTASVT
jgi:DNA-binding NarL/FixJ family response regulator